MKKDLTHTKGYIYKITSPSGKIYIGQSINPNERKSRYKNLACKEQKKIYRSIKKYGWENHTFEIIEECMCGENRNIINNREKYWINEYNSFKKSLNCDEGGRTSFYPSYFSENRCGDKNPMYGKTPWNKNKPQTDEVKKKLSIAHTGKTQSEETRNKRSKSLKNRIFSDDTKIKISENRTIHRVYCITNDKYYTSIKSAAISLNISSRHISCVCLGKRKSTYGYKFRYATTEEVEKLFI